MIQPSCRKRALSLGRGLLCDYTYFARGNHCAAAERVMQLADVVEARRRASPRPSWGAIMTKAFALAAHNHREMRQAYFTFPWDHIGEYEAQIASVIVHRQVDDEQAILLARLRSPETQSLSALDATLRDCMEKPVENFRSFRAALRVARMPRLIRRLLWWLALQVMPSRRARHFGTFGVTTMSPFGARTLQVPSLWAAFLHYGAISEAGDVPVGVVFDHRIMDGAVVGYTLMEMEQALHHDIVAELQAMRAPWPPEPLPRVNTAPCEEKNDVRPGSIAVH
jgi:hypothetical protein